MTLLDFQFKLGGVLTDATSVVLSDSAAAYGVRRTDTLAIVVAANTAMTHASTGVYQYTVTDPANGLTYQWSAKVVYAGSTYYFAFTATGPSAVPFVGRYTSTTLLKQRFGTLNVQTYSDTESNGVEDALAEQSAIQWAEDDIDSYFTGWRYTIPFTATGSALPHVLTEWATVLAGCWLYTKRGLRDEKVGGDLMALEEKTKGEMRMYRTPFRTLAGVAINTGVQTTPQTLAATTDVNGFTVNTSASSNNLLASPYGYRGPYGLIW